MSATLRQHERLKSGYDFRRARDQGRKVAGRLMLLNVYCGEGVAGRRLGVVTSKQLGNAVIRNRARRILREAWRLIKERIVEPCDLTIVARRAIVGRSMQEAQAELMRLLAAAGALKKRDS